MSRPDFHDLAPGARADVSKPRQAKDYYEALDLACEYQADGWERITLATYLERRGGYVELRKGGIVQRIEWP